jgi:hypothetical protein
MVATIILGWASVVDIDAPRTESELAVPRIGSALDSRIGRLRLSCWSSTAPRPRSSIADSDELHGAIGFTYASRKAATSSNN